MPHSHITIAIAIILFLFLIMRRKRCHQRKKWNEGICAKSGMPWYLAKIGPNGERVYRDGYGSEIWVNFNVDAR